MILHRTLARVKSPSDIPDPVIVVMGLLEMGCDDVAELSRLAGLGSTRQAERVLRALRTNGNRVIRRCMAKGLPAGVVRPFVEQNGVIRCPVCRNMVDHAPCPYCSLKQERNGSAAIEPACEVDDEPPIDDQPTEAKPGTQRKTRVMRSRIARGLSAFHPKDPQ